jgi:hypothetical protein
VGLCPAYLDIVVVVQYKSSFLKYKVTKMK